MKINEIKLVNYRSHASSLFQTDKKISIFIGPNNSGKSSVAHNIAWVLTGRNSVIDKDRQLIDEQVTFGESHSISSLELSGIGKVTRTIPHSFQVGDWTGSIASQESKLYGLLGCTKEQILCAIYSHQFINMNTSDQKNFMFNLIGLKLTDEIAKNEFLAWCNDQAIEDGERYWSRISEGISFDNNPDAFDELYDKYKDIRKRLKKEINLLENMPEIPNTLPQNISVEDRDNIVNKLEELNNTRDNLIFELGKLKNTVLISVLKDTIQKESILKDIPETQEELNKLIKTKLQSVKSTEKEIHSFIVGRTFNNNSINSLKNFSGICPINSLVKCKLAKEEINEVINSISKTNEESLKTEEFLNKERERLEKEYNDLLVKLEERKKRDHFIPEIEKAKIQLKQIEDSSKNVGTLETQLTELNARIAKGQAILTKIDIEKQNINIRKDKVRAAELKNLEMKVAEIAVKAFEPKGIKTLILIRAIKPLERQVNESLSILTNNEYKISFRIDEDFDIYITTKGKERKVRHLSSSEKMRIGIVIQHAISKLAGIKLLVLDDLEILDSTNRVLFFKMLNTIKQDFDSIILILTIEKVNATLYKQNDIKVFDFNK